MFVIVEVVSVPFLLNLRQSRRYDRREVGNRLLKANAMLGLVFCGRVDAGGGVGYGRHYWWRYVCNVDAIVAEVLQFLMWAILLLHRHLPCPRRRGLRHRPWFSVVIPSTVFMLGVQDCDDVYIVVAVSPPFAYMMWTHWCKRVERGCDDMSRGVIVVNR